MYLGLRLRRHEKHPGQALSKRFCDAANLLVSNLQITFISFNAAAKWCQTPMGYQDSLPIRCEHP
jgi:hypothetical protein